MGYPNGKGLSARWQGNRRAESVSRNPARSRRPGGRGRRMFASKGNAAVKRWVLPLVALSGGLLLSWGCGEKEPEASAPARDQAASSTPTAPPLGTAPPLAGGGPVAAPPQPG